MHRGLRYGFMVLGGIVGLFLILILIMFFLARRNNMTIVQFIQARAEARRASQAQDLTDTSKALVTGMNQVKIVSDGRTRTSGVYVPANYKSDTATPLVVAYHGGFAEGENQEKLTKMSETADKEGFIIAYPDGINRHWNDGRARAVKDGDVNDILFTKDLIAALSSRFNIDAKRIYATGISNGGMMSYRVACEMTQTFAAIAPVSSALPVELKAICKPNGAIPIMMIQGTADPLIPFNGGEMAAKVGLAVPTRDTLAYWIANNDANATPEISSLPDIDPNDGTTTTREVYSGSTPTSEIVFLEIKNGGHTWAGGRQYAAERTIGKTARDFNANDEIWVFFKRHSR